MTVPISEIWPKPTPCEKIRNDDNLVIFKGEWNLLSQMILVFFVGFEFAQSINFNPKRVPHLVN